MAQGVGIGAAGVVGIAFEETPNTYTAPTKFVVIRSEKLAKSQDLIDRRLLRGKVDLTGVVKGGTSVAGPIEMEVTEDVLPYFLYAMRADVTKTGSTNFTYTAIGAHTAEPVDGKTLSVTVVRNNETFGYTGVSVSQLGLSLDNGILIASIDLTGLDEATQTDPTAAYATVDAYGPGMYTYQVASTSICDHDGISFTINDNGTPQMRDCQRAAKFISWGEREVTAHLDRDFLNRTDYDAFLAATAQKLDFTASRGANNSVQVIVPVAVKDKYEFGLNGQAELIRASIDYRGVYDSVTGSGWQIVVKCQEDITFA